MGVAPRFLDRTHTLAHAEHALSANFVAPTCIQIPSTRALRSGALCGRICCSPGQKKSLCHRHDQSSATLIRPPPPLPYRRARVPFRLDLFLYRPLSFPRSFDRISLFPRPPPSRPLGAASCPCCPPPSRSSPPSPSSLFARVHNDFCPLRPSISHRKETKTPLDSPGLQNASRAGARRWL